MTRFMTQHKEASADPGLGETDGGANADASGGNNTPGAAGNTETVTVKNGKDANAKVKKIKKEQTQ